MEVFAKAALQKAQLDCKMRIGCDGIEIQLLDEFVNGRLGEYLNAKDVFNLQSFSHYPIRVVHCPLLSHYGLADVNLESFCDDDFKMLDEVFYVANYFGKLNNRRVIVVIHSETHKQNMMLVSNMWKQVRTSVGALLYKYPYTEIAIENVTPLTNVGSGNMHLCSNFKWDNIEMVQTLRQEFGEERVGTVLDTCHAMLTNKYMSAIFRELGDIEPEDYSMETYFAKNKDYIKLIHLADIKGNGYTKGNHGTSFCDENRDKLKYIMSLYSKYEYHCPITLEVGETDFLVSDGYATTRQTLFNVLSDNSCNYDDFETVFKNYCNKYKVTNARQEILRLQGIIKSTDKEVLRQHILNHFL